jgi:hypothetical protein
MALLREVAVAADRVYPADVSMSAWNSAPAAAGHADAPSAESLHQRVNRRAPRRVSWRQMLRGACRDGSSEVQTLVAARRQPIAKEIGERHVAYGLRLVATELGGRSFPADEYDAVRERLISATCSRRPRRQSASQAPGRRRSH